ncbi:MAG: hypothetical protein AAB625_00335 [Patescibacteria group bacterium]
MSNLTKKISLILLSSLLFLNSMAMPFAVALAADPAPSTWYNQGPFDWYLKVYDDESSPPSEIFGERYTAAQVQWIFYSLFSMVLNLVPGNPKTATCLIGKHPTLDCLKSVKETLDALTDTSTQNIASNNPVLNAIGQNPISGIGYVKNLINKFNPVTEVNAQGFGFNTGADSIKKLWQATRDISYALLVLAVIVISFMIMFRMKISPQLVISVQSALPNIIFTTILITFSYAIAGFAIDLMYVVIGLITSLLITSGFSGHDFKDLFDELTTNHSAFGLMYSYWVAFFYNAFLTLFTSSFEISLLLIIFAFLSILFIIFWSIKIIYVILKNFAMVVLTIAIGPLEILMGAFTGKSTFGGWLKKLISYLAVYPLLGMIFFFSFFFLVQGSSGFMSGITAKTIFGNPKHDIIGNNAWPIPFLGEIYTDNIIWIVVSFVIFSQATKVVEIIQGLITGKPFAYGSSIGETVGSIVALGKLGASKGIDTYENYRTENQAAYQTSTFLQSLKSLLSKH